MKLDILAIGVHPDDVELSCGATIAKLVQRGKNVGILDLTQGELGTRGNAKTREKEAFAAAEILQISVREQLDLQDGFFQDSEESQKRIIEVIRKYQPEIVLCNAPKDRHPDHGRAAKLTTTACFLSGLIKVQTQSQAWRPKHVFHYIQWDPIQPDFIVDVSGFLETKIESCKAYQSQFFNPNSSEPQTPISSKNFLDSIKYRSQDLGRLIGVEAGEGFIVSNSHFVGISDFDAFC